MVLIELTRHSGGQILVNMDQVIEVRREADRTFLTTTGTGKFGQQTIEVEETPDVIRKLARAEWLAPHLKG